ncbi:hypothetical protein [Spiroplasma endosymbiont of Polydrusus formosus]|uniref:hypothetical protein n=1 Tax=Spiroplasma endosymbiont of Polydrusus formosus TaxID=3139326 RepID=UPI0035B562F8
MLIADLLILINSFIFIIIVILRFPFGVVYNFIIFLLFITSIPITVFTIALILIIVILVNTRTTQSIITTIFTILFIGVVSFLFVGFIPALFGIHYKDIILSSTWIKHYFRYYDMVFSINPLC